MHDAGISLATGVTSRRLSGGRLSCLMTCSSISSLVLTCCMFNLIRESCCYSVSRSEKNTVNVSCKSDKVPYLIFTKDGSFHSFIIIPYFCGCHYFV